MSDSKIKPRQVKCPECGRLTLYTPENPYRPFCSERCRLIDLGEWASESYKIPVSHSENDDSDLLDNEFDEPSDEDKN